MFNRPSVIASASFSVRIRSYSPSGSSESPAILHRRTLGYQLSSAVGYVQRLYHRCTVVHHERFDALMYFYLFHIRLHCGIEQPEILFDYTHAALQIFGENLALVLHFKMRIEEKHSQGHPRKTRKPLYRFERNVRRLRGAVYHVKESAYLQPHRLRRLLPRQILRGSLASPSIIAPGFAFAGQNRVSRPLRISSARNDNRSYRRNWKAVFQAALLSPVRPPTRFTLTGIHHRYFAKRIASSRYFLPTGARIFETHYLFVGICFEIPLFLTVAHYRIFA